MLHVQASSTTTSVQDLQAPVLSPTCHIHAPLPLNTVCLQMYGQTITNRNDTDAVLEILLLGPKPATCQAGCTFMSFSPNLQLINKPSSKNCCAAIQAVYRSPKSPSRPHLASSLLRTNPPPCRTLIRGPPMCTYDRWEAGC